MHIIPYLKKKYRKKSTFNIVECLALSVFYVSAESHNIGQQNTLFSTWMSVNINAYYFLFPLSLSLSRADAFFSHSNYYENGSYFQCSFVDAFKRFSFRSIFLLLNFFPVQTNWFACIHAKKRYAGQAGKWAVGWMVVGTLNYHLKWILNGIAYTSDFYWCELNRVLDLCEAIA